MVETSTKTMPRVASDAIGHNLKKLTALFLLGASTGVGATYLWLTANNSEIGKVYVVRDIPDYSPNDYDGNVRSRLHVYLAGTSGHVKGMTCLFPPDTEMSSVYSEQRSRFDSFAGVSKLEVVGVAEHLSDKPYYCNALPDGPSKAAAPVSAQ